MTYSQLVAFCHGGNLPESHDLHQHLHHLGQVAFITDVIEDMISTYYTNNVAADENFLDHMYRIVSDDHLDDGFMKIGDDVAKMMMIKLLLVDVN